MIRNGGSTGIVRKRRRWLGSDRTGTRTLSVLLASPGGDERKRCADSLIGTTGISLSGEATSASETLEGLKQRPDVLLLDARLLAEHGMTLIPIIRRTSRRTRILLLARDASQSLLVEAMCRGAMGFIEGNGAMGSLPKAIRVIHAGQVWMPRRMVSDLVDCLIRLAPRRGLRRVKA
jgi:DNA-binding NarL/FixJ family response regulator